MKKLVIGLVVMGLTSSAFAQDVLYSVKVKEDKVPEEVVTAVQKDFKGFAVTEYSAIPITMVEDKMIVTQDKDFDPSDYDSYQVKIQGKGTAMDAYYDADGKLVSTYENIKNTTLPSVVERAISKKYPNAKLEGDRFVATYFANDGTTKVHYHVKVMNNGKKHRMYLDGNGNILRG